MHTITTILAGGSFALTSTYMSYWYKIIVIGRKILVQRNLSGALYMVPLFATDTLLFTIVFIMTFLLLIN